MPGSKVLLVEGKDDKHVLKHICRNRGIPGLVSIESIEGAERLLDHFPIRLKRSKDEGDTIGVVIDADTDLDARWLRIRNRLTQAGYRNVPDLPNPQGTILDPSNRPILPKFGVWIMPDNKTTGILEDFLRFLIPQPDALLNYAETCVDSVPEQRFTDLDEPKALMHTWLAWQEEPGRPYGTAITARFLDAGLPQADALASWLKRLFQ